MESGTTVSHMANKPTYPEFNPEDYDGLSDFWGACAIAEQIDNPTRGER